MSATTWDTSPERPPLAPPEPPEPEGERRWPPWSAPLARVTALIVATVGGLIVAIVATGFGYDFDAEDTPPGVLLGATFVQDIGFVASAILFARMSGPVWAQQFGLRGTRILSAVGWMGAAYIGFLVFLAIWAPLIGLDGADDQVDDLGIKDSDTALVFGAILVCVFAPVVEEFFFRGFFFTALRNWKGVWPAAVITGLVFGGIHLGSASADALLPLAVFGFGLCVVYAKTGSLYPCIALHAINNSIAFSTAIDWTWQMPLLVVGSLAVCGLVARTGAQAFPRRPTVD